MRGVKLFTGIIEEIGTVKSIHVTGNSGTVNIKAKKVLEGTKVGDSIAVNGICLTVTSMTDTGFTADVMAETVRRSSLSACRGNDEVNLERAMAADGRFGGHIVSGHIDGTGTITSLSREENAVWVTISSKPGIIKYIVEKGSVCIDGISLTVAGVNDDNFSVSVIPHTAGQTTLLKKRVGDMVNLENDIVGKYVERFLGVKQSGSGGITLEMLSEYGF